jgi:prepilin-type N-terminal cleavage/methylation domain-containing protein/prepilin-type processing-associated H-X9-DG protein
MNRRRFRRAGARTAPRPAGITLVELMVVIAIIGVALGLLIPIITRVREASRRAECTNNLKQITIAFHNYQDVHHMFPASYISWGAGLPWMGPASSSGDAGPGWGWGAVADPFMEASPFYNSCNMNLPCWVAANTTAARTGKNYFLCPSARDRSAVYDVKDAKGSSLATVARSHYVANAGRIDVWGDPAADLSKVADGPLYRNSWLPPSAITDGLNHTVFLGERTPALGDATWIGVVSGARTCPRPPFAVSGCDPAAAQVNAHSGPSANERPSIVHPPNSPHGHVDQMASEHPGGSNVALGDGSVRFIKSGISPRVWAALSTRAGGEPIAPGDLP